MFMRLILAVSIFAAAIICERSAPRATKSERAPAVHDTVDFAKSIQPILQKRCTPCHFEGGVMHARLPFDKPQTIVRLGTRLFSRIKDEESRDLIRKFLAQQTTGEL